ncbi:hypothetical protein JOQ06_000647 [Pogonophryne albipinna]|uniref:Uncharacterized protein n=1 Tax=Pogonophryne albipinna TaxID=1090488 RepID=A0AAD6AGP2_9TELE|nr:hypothetical protein JOQ06_000647 [Pogonophryne albipinna]
MSAEFLEQIRGQPGFFFLHSCYSEYRTPYMLSSGPELDTGALMPRTDPIRPPTHVHEDLCSGRIYLLHFE